MHRPVRAFEALLLALLLPALGCGGGGGGGNDGPDPTPTPMGTTTPQATTTPATTNRVVIFTLAASAPIQGVQVMAFYPTAKGGFTGSADGVTCGVPAEVFTPNDHDDGTLVFSLANSAVLSLPVEVRCTFAVNPGSELVASDVAASVTHVAADGALVDPARATVVVTVL